MWHEMSHGTDGEALPSVCGAKTSWPPTNSTFIGVLSFRTRGTRSIASLLACVNNGGFPRALLVWTTRPPRGSQRPTPPRPRSVSLLVAGPCPALHQSPRQSAPRAWQVDACPFVTFLVSNVHRHRVLVPFMQLF